MKTLLLVVRLFQQFLAPVFQLGDDGLDAADLFIRPQVNVPRIMSAQRCFRQLNHRMRGLVMETLAQFCECFDGDA